MTALPSTTSLPLWAWAGFLLFIAAMLALDLGVFRKKAKAVAMREALGWCGVWFSLALAFNGLIWWWQGSQSASEWFTAYLVELCLSVDNVFVFVLVFTYFKVPVQHQHRVLFWGILGATVMRLVFILAGVGLLERFHWLIYLAILGLRSLYFALQGVMGLFRYLAFGLAVILVFIGSKMAADRH